MKFGLYSSNLSESFHEMKDPLTGKVVKTYLDSGLTEFQLASVRKYLKSIGAYEAKNTGYIHVPLSSDKTLKIQAYGLLSGNNPRSYGLEWDTLSPEIAEIIFSIGVKGCMALRYELGSFYVFSNYLPSNISKRWRNIEHIKSTENLYKCMRNCIANNSIHPTNT